MNMLFRSKNYAGVLVDGDDTSIKHDSVALRERRFGLRLSNRKRVITCRRLDDWLISDWHFKRERMNLPGLDFEPVRSGLFYSLRLGGTWVAADWWINYFSLDEQVISLKLDELHGDINYWVLPLLPQRVEPFEAPPHINRCSTKHRLQLYLSNDDRQRIAEVNPRWTAWQSKVFNENICP